MVCVRTLLAMVLFIFFFSQSSELAQTSKFLENPEKESLLCKLFGIEQRWLSLMPDLQYLIVKHLEEKYPEAFFHTTVTEPAKSWPAHKQVIDFLALVDDGKKLISSADDSCLCVWEAHTGSLLHTIQEPGKGSVAVSHDKQKIAISQDHLVTIRNSHDFEIMQELNVGYRAYLLRFFKNSTMLLVASKNGMTNPIKLCNLATGDCLAIRHSFEYLTRAACVNLDGTLLAALLVNPDDTFGSLCLYLWNIAGEPQLILQYTLNKPASNLDFLTADKIQVDCNPPIIWDLTLNRVIKFVESCTQDSYFCDNRFLDELSREYDNYRKFDPPQLFYSGGWQKFVLSKNIFFMILPINPEESFCNCLWDIPSSKKIITLICKEERSFIGACLNDQANDTIYAAVHSRKTGTSHIRIWNVREVPQSFLTNRLTLKKALFILFFAFKIHAFFCSKMIQLKNELASIFKTFTETERAYLLTKYAPIKSLDVNS